jgi:hypothetical protein
VRYDVRWMAVWFVSWSVPASLRLSVPCLAVSQRPEVARVLCVCSLEYSVSASPLLALLVLIDDVGVQGHERPVRHLILLLSTKRTVHLLYVSRFKH